MSLLNSAFNTTHGTAPFTQIKLSEYKPAFEQAIAKAKEEIDVITSTTAAPTFENTLEALAYSGMDLDRISSLFFNLNSAETSDEMQKIAQEVAPMLSAFSNDVSLNEALFLRVKAVYEQLDALDLNTEQKTLLTKNYKS